MSWMAWSTALAGLFGLAIYTREWAISEGDLRSGHKTLAKAGFWVVLTTWLVLVPTTIYLWREGLTAAWLFGAETYDGGVVETVTALGLIASVLLAWRLALCSGHLAMSASWALVGTFGILAFGEEASWGQHIFHWSSTGAFAASNLQGETNLHNFISPRIYDIAYSVVGWGLIAGAALITVRPPWMGRLLRFVPFARSSPVGVALLVTAGVLIQHEVFEELAEAVAVLAFVFMQIHHALDFQTAQQSRRLVVSRV
jgi:hypothetical protein